MPCFEALEWIIKKTYIEKRIVVNDEGRCIASFQPFEIEKYYRLHQPEKYMIISFVEKIHRDNDIKKILIRS